MTQVFISYSRRDIAFVEQLASNLKTVGLDVWYDISGLEGGTRWRVEIEKAIQESQFVLVVLSPDSVASEWVEREFLYASNLRKNIIPLYFKQCDLPLYFLNVHFIDVQKKNYEKNFGEILHVLGVKSARKELGDRETENLDSRVEKRNKIPSKLIWLIVVLASTGFVLIGVLFGLPKLFSEPENSTVPTSTVTVGTIQESNTSEAISNIETSAPGSTEIVQNGTEMVLVPEGNFIMGSENGNDDEKPVHKVFLNSFYIDKYEVTNAQFSEFLNSVGAISNRESSPEVNDEKGNPWITELIGSSISFENGIWTVDDEYLKSLPANGIFWNGAQAYCDWRGARLPTEAEWEKAARGTDGRTYPWGEELYCDFVNYSDCGFLRYEFSPVGSHPKGISPYGVHDMSGNVSEWVSDWYSSTYYSESPTSNPQGPFKGEEKVARGAFLDSPTKSPCQYLTTTCREKLPEDRLFYTSGFRCAKDIAP